MKKIINPVIYILFVALLSTWVAGCSSMDEYLDKYTDGKEIRYPGIPYPALMYSGKERVVFNGYRPSDPKVTRLKIYWNSRLDSLEQDIERSEGTDEFFIPISLPEGGYNFDIFTFDDEGNRSIPVTLSATSYGQTYQSSLTDRVIKSIQKTGSDVTIDWYSIDPTSPFVEITYPTLSGTQRVERLHQDSTKIVLEDFKAKSRFKMRTYYLPDEMSIDTFATDVSWIPVNEDVTADYILNAGNPFVRGDNGTEKDKFGTPKDWKYTDNVLNQKNGMGGWSTNGTPSGVIQFESKNFSGEGMTNGKIYQTIQLPAGKYLLESYSSNSTTGRTSFLDCALVAAKGTELPDLENIESSLGYYLRQETATNAKETYLAEFELSEESQVTIGYVASFGSSSSIQFAYIKLFFVPQE